ncbi:MAG: YjjG family noncanonical pyrimidine nucleotidase [Cyclobacteriaceae bacterium]
MAKKYKCVIFDLDHTLWDYDTNCTETLSELHAEYKLERSNIKIEEFVRVFMEMNYSLWDQYDLGLIQRDVIRYQRFHRILLSLGVDDYKLSLNLSSEYVSRSPAKGNLMPNAKEILEYLNGKYQMIIITNGFDDIQATKLQSSGIQHYFEDVITSEKIGHKKPAKQIFDYALSRARVSAQDALMIGDNLNTDIKGAHNASVDATYFNPHKRLHNQTVHHEISDLSELKMIL